ncbi:MAG: hypothetical protein NT027_08405, partial [Proteobacteria bacterium]|nr:hypothetical protein [Pseudomonadota bacterium]
MKRNVDSFRKISSLIKKLSGIDLQPGKESLLDARLYRRLDDLGLDSLDDYLELLMSSPGEQKHCIELITTHKTEWFREMVHFIWLKEQVLKAKKFPITIWSAACSSGEEVYSIMFMLLKLGIPYDKFRILGTDISDK